MTTGETSNRQVGRFEKLAAKVEEIFKRSTDRGGAALEAALTEAREKLQAAGELGREEGEELERWLRRDLQLLRQGARSATQKAEKSLDPSRLGSAFLGLASTLMGSASETLKTWAAKADDATSYRTGEVTGPGTLTCRRCETKLRMESSTRIPPCPKCHATDFTKSY